MAWRSRTSSCRSSRPVVAIAALVAFGVALAACSSSKRAPIAELASAQGPVERDEAGTGWAPAPIGTAYFLGDAARTGPGPAQLAIASGERRIEMKPHSVVRFGGTRGGSADRRIMVEAGAVELRGGGDYSLDIGDVKVAHEGAVRITARGGGQSSIELVVGAAQVSTAGGTVALEVGKAVELGIGAVVITPGTADAGPADAGAVAAVDAGPADADAAATVAIEATGRLEWQRPGEPWKPMPPGTATLDPATKIRLGPGAKATLSARGTTLELGGGARTAIEPDLTFSVEAGAVKARAVSDGTLVLPGGTLELKTTASGAAPEAAVDVGAREARVAIARGTAKLSGAPGTVLDMARGEIAMLGRAGTIRVIEAIPAVFDLRIPTGESLTIHDPRPPTAVQFHFGGKCPDGGIIELDRGGGFRTPRMSAGEEAANLRIDYGVWAYRLRCTTAGGAVVGTAASGRITVQRDAGIRPLPPLPPPNDIEADGRTWRVSYQSLIPDLRVQIRRPGASYRVQVARDGKAQAFSSTERAVKIPGASLREGTYTYWVEVDGARQGNVSTLIIDFDQTAAQVSIESPADGVAWTGDLDVRGTVLPGWEAKVEGVELPLDRQRRFSAKVGAPPGAALAIRLQHRQRGIHYYLRRPK